MESFARQLSQLKHRYKVVIAGNHELSFDPITRVDKQRDPRELLLGDFIYLEDSGVTVKLQYNQPAVIEGGAPTMVNFLFAVMWHQHLRVAEAARVQRMGV